MAPDSIATVVYDAPITESLTTKRLILRQWRPEDVEPMAAINRYPSVTEFLNRPVDEHAVAVFVDVCASTGRYIATACGQSNLVAWPTMVRSSGSRG